MQALPALCVADGTLLQQQVASAPLRLQLPETPILVCKPCLHNDVGGTSFTIIFPIISTIGPASHHPVNKYFDHAQSTWGSDVAACLCGGPAVHRTLQYTGPFLLPAVHHCSTPATEEMTFQSGTHLTPTGVTSQEVIHTSPSLLDLPLYIK